MKAVHGYSGAIAMVLDAVGKGLLADSMLQSNEVEPWISKPPLLRASIKTINIGGGVVLGIDGVPMEKATLGPRPFMPVMPAVLVGANVSGKPNYMTVAWAGVACMSPPMIAVAINKVRHTEKGILENRTFSVNVPAAKDAAVTDHCGMVSGGKVDKSALFETFYGKLATAPLIREFPVNIECELRHTLELGSHNLHVGEVIDIHVSKECMSGDLLDLGKIDPILYSGAGSYARIGEVVGKAFSIGRGYKK